MRSWADHRNPQISILPNNDNSITSIEIVKKFLNPATNESISKDYMHFTSLNSDLIEIFGTNYNHTMAKLFWWKCVQMANTIPYFPFMDKGRLKNSSFIWVSVLETGILPNVLFRNAINAGIANAVGSSRGLIQDQRGFHYSWENILQIRFENRTFWHSIYQTMLPQIDENLRKWVGIHYDYMQSLIGNPGYFETIGFISLMMAIMQLKYIRSDSSWEIVTKNRRNIISYAVHMFCYIVMAEAKDEVLEMRNIPVRIDNFSRKFKNMLIQGAHYSLCRSVFYDGFSQGSNLLLGKNALETFRLFGISEDILRQLVEQERRR